MWAWGLWSPCLDRRRGQCASWGWNEQTEHARRKLWPILLLLQGRKEEKCFLWSIGFDLPGNLYSGVLCPDEHGHWAGQDHSEVKVHARLGKLRNIKVFFIPTCPGAARILMTFTAGSHRLSESGVGLGQNCNRNNCNRNFSVMLHQLVPPLLNQNCLVGQLILTACSVGGKTSLAKCI